MDNKRQYLPEKECRKFNEIFLPMKTSFNQRATMNIIAPNFTLKQQK